MLEARRNVMIGLFVLFGVGALGALIVLFGVGPTRFLGGRGYPLYIQFAWVSGIQEGNRVTLGGIEIGQVVHVAFFDPDNYGAGVRVTVRIDEQYRIPVGSRAETTESSFGYGRPTVQIIPGPADMGTLEPNSVIPGETRRAVDALLPEGIRSTFDKTATQLGGAAEALTPVLKDLHEILQARRPEEVDRVAGPPGNMASAMTRLDTMLRNWNEVMGDPAVKSQVKETVANFHQMSEDGKVAVANLRETSDQAREFEGRPGVCQRDAGYGAADRRRDCVGGA